MKKRPLALSVTLLLACSNVTENIICTEIGCNDGLSIEVSGTSGARATVEVTAAGQPARTFECAAGQPCRGFLDNYMPTQATVTVRLPDRTVQRTVTPSYIETQPNGPKCPPVCRQASVQVAV